MNPCPLPSPPAPPSASPRSWQAKAGHALLRLAVTGGGCSGFQYNFALDETRMDDDLFVEEGRRAASLIDPVSLDFLAGAEIDFTDGLIGQAFKVNNPNATAVLRLRHQLFGLTPE